jgi:hypothetical protein
MNVSTVPLGRILFWGMLPDTLCLANFQLSLWDEICFANDKLQRCRADGAGILLNGNLNTEYSFNHEAMFILRRRISRRCDGVCD